MPKDTPKMGGFLAKCTNFASRVKLQELTKQTYLYEYGI